MKQQESSLIGTRYFIHAKPVLNKFKSSTQQLEHTYIQSIIPWQYFIFYGFHYEVFDYNIVNINEEISATHRGWLIDPESIVEEAESNYVK